MFLLIIYSVLSVNKVEVNQDITSYLSEETETRKGLNIMEDEFVTYGSACNGGKYYLCGSEEQLADKFRGSTA